VTPKNQHAEYCRVAAAPRAFGLGEFFCGPPWPMHFRYARIATKIVAAQRNVVETRTSFGTVVRWPRVHHYYAVCPQAR